MVTVMKMSEIVSMKQKPEKSNTAVLNDLEKLLEKENRLKVEENKKLKAEKERLAVTSPNKESKKKSGKSQSGKQFSQVATVVSPLSSENSQKSIILAKKSLAQQKEQNAAIAKLPTNGPINKNASHIDNKSQSEIFIPAKRGQIRRNSFTKQKEQWVVSTKTPALVPLLNRVKF